jgi:hypothetical protein
MAKGQEMNFEAIDFEHKRVRKIGNREWKLWFTESEDQLSFRMLTKDKSGECYESLSGVASAITDDDLLTREDENDNAYFTDRFLFKTEVGMLDFYLDIHGRELVWVEAYGEYDRAKCSLGLAVPLMPEVAG